MLASTYSALCRVCMCNRSAALSHFLHAAFHCCIGGGAAAASRCTVVLAAFPFAYAHSGMIDKLKADNEQLKDELQLEKRHSKVYDSVSAQAQIAKLQDTGDMYTRKIELEKRRIEELDKQMEIMHKKIWEQRQKMGGVNASRETNQAIAKQIQILENRLDKALKRYNEALANNKRLRENIDNLRRERLVFDQIYRKLEKVRHWRFSASID